MVLTRHFSLVCSRGDGPHSPFLIGLFQRRWSSLAISHWSVPVEMVLTISPWSVPAYSSFFIGLFQCTRHFSLVCSRGDGPHSPFLIGLFQRRWSSLAISHWSVPAEMVLTRLDLPDLLEQEVTNLSAMKERHRQEVNAEAAKAGSADPSAQSQTLTRRQSENSQPTNVITVSSQSQGDRGVDAGSSQQEVAESSATRTSRLQQAGNPATAASQRESRSSTVEASDFESTHDDGGVDNGSNVWPAASSRNRLVSLGSDGDVQSSACRPDGAPGSTDSFSHRQLDDLETSALSDLFNDSTHEAFASLPRDETMDGASVSVFSAAKKMNPRLGDHRIISGKASIETSSGHSEDLAAADRRNQDHQERVFSVPLKPVISSGLTSEARQTVPDSCISQTIQNRICKKDSHQGHRPQDPHPDPSDPCGQSCTSTDLLDSIDKEHAGKLVCVKKNSKAPSESSRRLTSRLKDRLNSFVRSSRPDCLSRGSGGGGHCETTSSAREGKNGAVESRSPSADRSQQEKRPNFGNKFSASSKKQQSVISSSDEVDDDEAREAESVPNKQQRQSSDSSKGKPNLAEKENARRAESEATTDSAFSSTHRRTSAESMSQSASNDSSLPKKAKQSHRSASARTSSSELDDSRAESLCGDATPRSKVSWNTLSKLKQFSFSSSADESPSDNKKQHDGQRASHSAGQDSSLCDQPDNTVMHSGEPCANACAKTTSSLDRQRVRQPGQKNISKSDPSGGSAGSKDNGGSTLHCGGAKYTESITSSASVKSAGKVQSAFFQLPDDSDEDSDSFSGTTSAKKRKCFQLANDSDNDDTEDQRRTRVSGNASAIPDSQESFFSSQSSVQDDSYRADGKQLPNNTEKINPSSDRCETPSHLLQSQDSLTVTQSSIQNQVKDMNQGQTVAAARQKCLPTVGGTPSNSQGNLASSTPVVSKQNETESLFPKDSNGNMFEKGRDSVVSGKNNNSAGKTTPAWLMKLNSQRKCPTSASTVSSSLSSALTSPFMTVDDDDLDLDLDFDQPFKKQRKSWQGYAE